MSNGNSKLTRYETVAQEVEAMVAKMESGMRLPSIRDLMRRFNASQVTIDRGFDILMGKGLIEKVAGRGVFVAEKYAGEEARHIDLCFFFEESSLIDNNGFYVQMSGGLLEEAHKHNLNLNLFVYDQAGKLPAFRKRIERSNPDAIILMCVNRQSFELVLRDMGLPTLLLFPNAMDENSSSLLMDNLEGVRLAVNHLVDMGHERIAFLHGQGCQGWYMLHQEERIEGFYRAIRERGLLVPNSFVKYGGFSDDEGRQACHELLTQNNPPTAIICNDYNAKGVMQAIRDKGLRIPEDISVVGFDDVALASETIPPLSTISVGWGNIATQAIEAISEMLAGNYEFGRMIRTPVEMVVRNTTAPRRKGSVIQTVDSPTSQKKQLANKLRSTTALRKKDSAVNTVDSPAS